MARTFSVPMSAWASAALMDTQWKPTSSPEPGWRRVSVRSCPREKVSVVPEARVAV